MNDRVGGSSPLSEVSLRDLRYLVAAIDAGSLSAAARRLQVAQPTLSHALARLERQAGQALLDRPRHRRSGVRATAAGAVFARRARRLLAEAEALADDLALAAGLTGEVRLLAIQSLNATLLPPVLAAVVGEHPGLRLRLRTVDGGDLPRVLLAGHGDLGLLAGPSPAELEGVACELLHHEPFAAILRRDDPLAGRERLPLAALAERDLVLADADSWTGRIARMACLEAGFTPCVRLSLASGEALRELVRAGLGCSLLPVGYVPPEDGALVAVRLAAPEPRRPVLALHDPDYPPGPATAAVLAALRHHAGRGSHP